MQYSAFWNLLILPNLVLHLNRFYIFVFCHLFKVTGSCLAAGQLSSPTFLSAPSTDSHLGHRRGERERLFGSREREGKLEIIFPFYGKGTGIRKCYGKGMGNLRLVIPGIYKTSNVKFKIREALIREYFLVKSLHKMAPPPAPPPLSPFYEVPIYLFFSSIFRAKKR